MNKWKFRKSLSRFIKCHILCARSAFIEKSTNAALQESFNDLSESHRQRTERYEDKFDDVLVKRIADEQKSTPSVITREQTVTSASPDPSSSGTSPLQSSPPPAVIERRTEEDQTRQNLLPSSSPATPPTTTITVGPSKNYYRQILIIM